MQTKIAFIEPAHLNAKANIGASGHLSNQAVKAERAYLLPNFIIVYIILNTNYYIYKQLIYSIILISLYIS